MPTSIIIAAAGAAGVVAGFAASFPVLTAMVAIFAVSTIASRFLTPNQNKNTQNGSLGNSGSRQQVQPDTTTPIPITYGECFLGGKFVDAALSVDQKVMYYVMAISCISENGTFTFDKTNMYYGDRKITFLGADPAAVESLTDTAGNVDTTILSRLKITLFTSDKDGVITNHTIPGQMPWGSGDGVMGADSGIIAAQQWASTNRNMNGLAFAIIRLVYSQEAGTTQLQPITFYVKQYLNGPYVAKPGDVWKDYMTNTVYGAAVPLEFIDTASADSLNTYSDELITFNDYDGNPQTQPRYRIAGVLDPSQSCLQNIDQIMTACDSWQRYDAANGKWAVVVNKASSSQYAFNDSNMVGAIVVGSVDIAQMPNQIEAKFPDGANRDQYNYVNKKVPTGLLLPNEPINKQTLTFDLVNNSVQALYLANRVLEQAREDLLVTINTTYDGIQVNAGDVVSITNSYYGWSAKLFRAMQVREAITPEGILGAQIQFVEYNSQVYDNFDITQFSPDENGDLDSGFYFSDLSPPAVVDAFPYDPVPTFDINVAIPLKGRVTSIILFYTTVSTPTASDWQVLDTQTLSDSVPFTPGTAITFTDFNLSPASYYFAYKVGNSLSQSALSPASTVFNWNPDPANANSFLLTLNPVTLQVPFNGTTASLTGINFRLYGSNGLGAVQYVTSTTDADAAFVAGTWRIGGSSTTGTGDIVQTGITFPLPPTDGGTYAQFGTATAMTASPATVLIPVRYKDLSGTVRQVSPATMQAVYATQGQQGNKSATAFLYQWSTTTPANPSGTSIFSWATGSSSSYTGGGGWSTSAPANPGVPLIRLWVASKLVSDVFNATTTSVSWTSGYAIVDTSQNGATGASGIQSATPTVFQWAITIPSAPTGTSTYTWASSSFTPIPSGWSASPPASPSPGFTLWGASVQLTESAGTTTSTINWTTSGITARGYAGSNGTTGTAGASSRICYSKTTLSSLASTPTTITTTGSSSFPPNDSWGTGTVWQATPPTIVAGESVYQSDGIYNPATGNTIWNVPYLSNLKVGNLQAISVNTGDLNVGTLTGGTITGSFIQTATSGKRVVISNSTNDLQVYNAAGTVISSIGGSGGTVFAVGQSIVPAVFGTHAGTLPAVFGSNTYGTNDDSAVGVQGQSDRGPALLGTATYAGGSNHGLRASNFGVGGTATGGLVGVANGYDFYAEGAGINYGPFTGAHDVLVPNGTTINEGYICVDLECIIRKNISNTVFEIVISSNPNQVPSGVFVINNGSLANFAPAAFIEKYNYVEVNGIKTSIPVYYPEYDLVKNDYQYCAMNAVGEGQVYVCGEAGNIAAGDLIVTSSTPGVGMKQSDGIVRNITVAKAREAITFTDTTTPVLVACIYLCG